MAFLELTNVCKAFGGPPVLSNVNLTLERGEFVESEAVYHADLKRHPKNVWALHGLVESLEKQGKAEAAAEYKSQFEAAVKRADVKIDRSCYCRLPE